MEVWQFVAVPIGLGLLGFVEPCSVGAHSLFVAHLRRLRPAARFAEVVQFTIPLLAATLAAGTSATDLAQAFFALFLFGAALSVPLGAVIIWPQAMERLSAIAARARGRRSLTGALIVALGVLMILFER